MAKPPEIGQVAARLKDHQRKRFFSLPPSGAPPAPSPSQLPASAGPGGREAVDLDDYVVYGAWHRVRLLPVPERTPGGILLPDDCTLRLNTADGVIQASGPGKLFPNYRMMMWGEPGDRVIFQPIHFYRVEKGEGFVPDWDLIAVYMDVDRVLRPLNDWVMVLPDPAPVSGRVITLTTPPPRSGLVQHFGPGLLQHRGPFAGLRRKSAPDVKHDQRVYWGAAAEVVEVEDDEETITLVRASELLAVEG